MPRNDVRNSNSFECVLIYSDVDGVPYHADIIDKKIAQAAFANATRRKQSAGYARER